MKLLQRMKAMAGAAASAAPGMAGKALAIGSAAASAAANAATGAFENVRDFAADRLPGSHFTDTDVDQAAGAMELLQLGVKNPDGTFRPLTEDELRQMARIVLVATLEDDDPAEGEA